MLLIVIILAIAIFYLKFGLKIKVKWKSFLKRGFKPSRGKFGLYVYHGKQGKGKTYSLVEYLIDNDKNIKVFSNITGIKNVSDITYYNGFAGLIEIKKRLDSGEIKTDKQIVIVFDEVFTELQRYSKLNNEVMDFLCQMRKRGIIFLTTAQEWSELPIAYRKFCRYAISCNMINIGFTGILLKTFGDAENMKWNNDTQEHECPIIDLTLSHCRKHIADSYDTFLRISSAGPSAAADERNLTITEIMEKIEFLEEEGSVKKETGITDPEGGVYAGKTFDTDNINHNE